MTVGVPEINLDTWGLKYVKKKGLTNFGGADRLGGGGNVRSNRTADEHGRESETTSRGGSSSPTQGTENITEGKEAKTQAKTRPSTSSPTSGEDTKQTGKPSGRGMTAHGSGSSPSSITATNRISDADVKTPDSPKHITGTQGSDERRTYGADRKERNQQYDIPPTDKLTPKGEAASKNPQNPKGVASGAQASHESGIQSVETRTGKDRSGVKVDPEKKGKPAHSALPKAKAEMELAIIKCKLLKMNDISKRGEWDHLPHAQKEKEEEEKETKKGAGGTEQEQSPKANDGTPQGAKVSDKEIKDKKLDHVYRSEDVVDKAIELINEAYGEIKETKKAKDDYCRHCGSKKEHLDSEGKQIPEGDEEEHYDHVDTSSKGHANREGFSKETKKDAPTGTGSSESNVPSKRKEQALNEDIRSKRFPNLKEPQDKEGQRSDQVIGDLGSDKKEGREDWVKVKDGGTSTTSSEGGFNHVYSDVHEAKRQKQNQ